MQLIALKFLAALAGNGNLTAAAVALLADLYFDQRRVRNRDTVLGPRSSKEAAAGFNPGRRKSPQPIGFNARRRSHMSTNTKPSIVFCHGLWADGSCFSKVIPTLQADGHEVVSTQNSLDTLEGDVAAVKRALGQVSSPAILVGHSQGGTSITAAGIDDRVAGLVYICALAPDGDETAASLQAKFP